jgi:hypothetical protein
MGEHYRIIRRAARPSVGLLHRSAGDAPADLRLLFGLLAVVRWMLSILLCGAPRSIAPAMTISAALVSALGSAGAANSPTHDHAPTQQRCGASVRLGFIRERRESTTVPVGFRSFGSMENLSNSSNYGLCLSGTTGVLGGSTQQAEAQSPRLSERAQKPGRSPTGRVFASIGKLSALALSRARRLAGGGRSLRFRPPRRCTTAELATFA